MRNHLLETSTTVRFNKFYTYFCILGQVVPFLIHVNLGQSKQAKNKILN